MRVVCNKIIPLFQSTYVPNKPESERGATQELCKWSVCSRVTSRRMPPVSSLQVATGGGWKMTNSPRFPVRLAGPEVQSQANATPSLSKRQSYSCCDLLFAVTGNRLMGRMRLPLWSLLSPTLECLHARCM